MASDALRPPLRMDLRVRLSIMMFLEFAIWGSWFVLFFDYLLKTIHFDGTQAGLIFGNMALGAIIANLFIGQLADRFFDSEKLLGVLHLIGAGLLYTMAQIQSNDFAHFMIISLIYAVVYNGTLTLANSITFANVPDGARDFPGLRVLGTIGWIAVNLFVGSKYIQGQTNEPLLLGALLSAVMGVFSFTLPRTPPSGKSESYVRLLGKAVGLFRDRSFALFFTISGLITIVLAFYYSNTATYLISLNPEIVPENLGGYFLKAEPDKPAAINAANTMLIGQVVEMVLLPFLPWVLRRIGMKWVLTIGMLSWGLRYLLFSQCQGNFYLILLGVALHGVCFDFFFAAGFIHVDNSAPRDIRASGQALFSFLTYGLGMWLGSILSGKLNKHFPTPGGQTDWTSFWLVPSAGVLIAVAVFVLFFRGEAHETRPATDEEQMR
jgi:nucleoside transporter